MKHIVCRAFVIASILIWDAGPSAADDMRAWLGRKDVAVEAAVRTLVVATFAAGNAKTGLCIHERYFGSPLKQRFVLSAMWPKNAADPYMAMLGRLVGSCEPRDEEIPHSTVTLHPEDIDLWGRTNNGAILLQLRDYHEAWVDAAAGMLEAYARADGGQVADCIAGARASGAMAKAGLGKGDVPISIAVHDALREVCRLNAENPAAASLSLPAMPDVEIVARERLLIVQDNEGCSGAGSFTSCVHGKYKARAKVLWPYLLRKL